MKLNNVLKIIIIILMPFIFIRGGYAALNYDDAYTEAINYGQIAEKLESNGQFDEAIEYYKKTEGLFSDIKDENNVAVTKMKIGVAYGKKGEYEIALEYLQDARKTHHKLNDISGEIASIGNSGKVYLLKGDLENAFLLFNDAYNLSLKIADKRGEGIALVNIGDYYKEKEDYNSAILYYKNASDIFLNIVDLTLAGWTEASISYSYSSLNDWNNAIYHIEQSKSIFESINDTLRLEYATSISGDIYYRKASYFLTIDDFNYANENFQLAEEEYKKIINLIQPKFSYSYTLMKEGDLFSRNNSNDKAIEQYTNSLRVLQELIADNTTNKIILLDIKNLISGKLNFENGKKAASNLNYIDAVGRFGAAETNFREIVNSPYIVDKKGLINGYIHYSSSKKNYFLFMSSGDYGNKVLSQDELTKARDAFYDAGYHELARDVIEEKLINFPDVLTNYKDNLALIEGLGFQKIQFNENALVNQNNNITFNYGYIFKVPYNGLPAVKFCCDEFCSEWYKILDNEIREAKIKVFSPYPRKIDCDIKIYNYDKSDISMGKIDDFYYTMMDMEPKIQDNNIIFEISEKYPYRNVTIIIDKPLHEKIIDIIRLPQAILGIFASIFTIIIGFKNRKHIKKVLESIKLKLLSMINSLYVHKEKAADNAKEVYSDHPA